MHDAGRVRFGHGVGGLKQEVHRVFDGKRAALQDRGEVGALQKLHHDVRGPVFEPAHVGDARDVLALDLHRCTRFPHEARRRLGAFDGMGKQELHRHALVELEVRRLHDDAHAARTEHALDPVLTREDVACCDGRFRRSIGHLGKNFG